jgi:hypothetical protein
MSIGVPELLILGLLVVPFALVVLALIDALSRPPWAWQQADQNKALWTVLLAVGVFVCGIGLVIALVYAFMVRPQLIEAAATPAPGTQPPREA